MTQITRKSVPMRGLILLLTVTLGAGLVLVGCGDDDTATTPAPAPPPPPPPPAPEPEPEPEPPAPEAPATPTGLMVSATTENSITWTWDAVEGVIGYAVQVSADEMFDETDTIHPAAEATFTAAPLPPETSVFVRVAAAGGTLEAPLLSAWTTHVTGTSAMPPPPPPAPMAPATPTGLMSETGEGSITWSWDAVEGADGYAVQVSMDEMFDDMDATTYTMETSHSVADLGYSETRYARVASTSGEGDAMLMSMWTTHTTGTSMAEPPPPPAPAPDPVEVTFSLSKDADDGHFLIADPDDDDAETAMASVNSEIMVASNTDAIITPMFVDGANGVSVADGDNMPFGRVSWGLLQSEVLDGDATFMVQRAVIGANQEMEPSGDVAYVTCGPFTCTDGMDAPALTLEGSAVCTAWEEAFTIDLQVGKVDNDVVGDPDGDDTTGIGDSPADVTNDTGNDGIDLGWVTSANAKTTVKHVFDGVANGTNGSVSTEAAKGSDEALEMKNFNGALLADTDATMDGIQDPCRADDQYDMERGGHFKPDGCFRFLGPGPADKAPDYLSGYTLDISPADIGVAWGNVDWEDDPFEGLECESMSVTVSDHVDVCDMFDAEVSYATGGGWSPTVVFSATNTVMRWEAPAKKAKSGTSNFTTVWFDDNLNGDIKKDKGDRHPDGGNALNDLYNQNKDISNIQMIWESLLDKDNDLIADAGDLGKVDLLSSKDDRSTADDERTIEVESCATGTSYAPRDGYESDNTTRDSTALDDTPCKTTAQKGTLDGSARDASDTATATNPDGNADNYETTTYTTFAEVSTTTANNENNRTVDPDANDFYTCSEDDGGNDEGPDGDSSCDARDWENDVTIKFTDGTFGCTAERDITVSCTWDADGGMAQGRNALPTEAVNFDDDPDDGTNNLANFLKCKAS